MTAILIFIVIIIGLNLIPQLTKNNFPKTEKAIIYWIDFHIVKFILLPICQVHEKELVSILLLIPAVSLSIYLQVFNQTVGCFKITRDLSIVISCEAFLGCGEIIRLTTSKFAIFDKELFYDSSQCLRGISKIETIEFNNKQAKFLIYHNGEMDSENPYHYEIKNRSMW